MADKGFPMNPYLSSIKVDAALKYHARYSDEGGLPWAFGDGFLYHHNAVYKKVREVAQKKFGIKYVQTDNVFNHVTPYLSLREMLRKNQIQSWNTQAIVQQFIEAQGSRWTVKELLEAPIKFDYILHESAHLIFDNVWRAEFGLKGYQWGDDQHTVMRMFLAESVATSVEHFSQVQGFDEFELIFSTLLGSGYVPARSRYDTDICVFQFGLEASFKYLVLGFLTALFQKDYLYVKDQKNINKIISGSSAEIPKAAMRLFLVGMRLDLGFINMTSKYYAEFLGSKKPLEEIIQFDPYKYILNNPKVLKVLDKVFSLIFVERY